MTFEEKLDRFDGIFAWDTGCGSSGIKDTNFKRSLMGNIDELEKLLAALAKQYLNSDQGYTIEDIAALLQWAENEFDLVYA
jgi:hypothetical protein